MKKILSFALVLVFLMICASSFAEEEHLTVENCEELAAILSVKNEFDQSIKDFAANHKGEIIEFDGNIAYIANHGSYNTRYDILVYGGDYSETSVSGPSFQFEDVGVIDLGLSGLFLPDFVKAGSNIHIVAEVEGYNEMSGLFELDTISIAER